MIPRAPIYLPPPEVAAANCYRRAQRLTRWANSIDLLRWRYENRLVIWALTKLVEALDREADRWDSIGDEWHARATKEKSW